MPKNATPSPGLTAFPGVTAWGQNRERASDVWEGGEGATSTRSEGTAAQFNFSYNGSNTFPSRGPRVRGRNRACGRGQAVGRERPRPRGRRGSRQLQGSPAPSRGQRRRGPRAAEAGNRAHVPPHPPPPGQREEQPLPVSGRGLCLRRRPGRARARLARQEPSRTKSWEQRASGAEDEPSPRSPPGRAGLDTAAPDVGRQSPSHAGVFLTRRLTQREPAPGRCRSPNRGRRRRRRGGATGSATRSPGSSCGRGSARCGVGLIQARRSAPGSP